MADAERIFNSCKLDLIVPDSVVQLPLDDNTGGSVDTWLAGLRSGGERHNAFFDEKLDFFLTVFFHPEDESSKLPSSNHSALPALLLTILNHLQVSVDATYIPPRSQSRASTLTLPALPKRTSSATLSVASNASIPSIFAPQTPNPVPAASDNDQKYVFSEGTLLKSFVWGDEQNEGDADSFRLLYSDKDECWVAIYKLSVVVAYTQVQIRNPLLCLTVSITLRDKPLLSTPQRQCLTDLISGREPLPPLLESQQAKVDVPGVESRREQSFLDQVNVLDGVPNDTSGELFFPVTRLSSAIGTAYSQRSISAPLAQNGTPHTSRKLPVLRKAFRKTLSTMSGFHVRMRTVMVPHIHFPGDNGDEYEAASDEATVVLSIEIEKGGESEAGFSVEDLDVSIKGGGVKVRLIGWGEQGGLDSSKVFPLLVQPMEQYNLLYALRFHQPPDVGGSEDDRMNEFRKAVSIVVTGRPYIAHASAEDAASQVLSYPTNPFQSRWNCVLDLRPRTNELVQSALDSSEVSRGKSNALPVPASPFPAASPNAPHPQEQASSRTGPLIAVGTGFKRHTYAGTSSINRSSGILPRNDSNARGSPFGSRPMSVTGGAAGGPGRAVSIYKPAIQSLPAPPSSESRMHYAGGPFSPPLPPLPGSAAAPNFAEPPQTPTPAAPWPGSQQARHSVHPGEPWQTPVPWTSRPANANANSGPVSIPPPSASIADPAIEEHADFVVSVSLVPPSDAEALEDDSSIKRTGPPGAAAAAAAQKLEKDSAPDADTTFDPATQQQTPLHRSLRSTKTKTIHPLDQFALEIFVFNTSPRVRTLEASIAEWSGEGGPVSGTKDVPGQIRERRQRANAPSTARQTDTRVKGTVLSHEVGEGSRASAPGFMPLESRVRIGPLGPSTCQSVNMHFIALTPGLHCIDGLVLTDLETGEWKTLRRVMDFAILSRNGVAQ